MQTKAGVVLFVTGFLQNPAMIYRQGDQMFERDLLFKLIDTITSCQEKLRTFLSNQLTTFPEIP